MHQRIVNDIENCNLLYISKTSIDEDFRTNMHSHPNLEILLVTNGEGRILTTNRKIKVKKGSLVILNPNCMHYEADKGLSFYAIGMKKTNIFLNDAYMKKIIYFDLNEKEYDDYHSVYDMIYNESLYKKNRYQEVINHLLDTIMLLTERKNVTISDNSNNSESELVSNIKNIIDTYYYQDIKLDDIAHRLSESKSNICHIFKKETGMTIIEYKINKQLEEASSLLKISDMNISEIASLVGFNDTSYFIRYFKRKYNKTPKQYKEENKENELAEKI